MTNYKYYATDEYCYRIAEDHVDYKEREKDPLEQREYERLATLSSRHTEAFAALLLRKKLKHYVSKI
jgi:hypothetical protein